MLRYELAESLLYGKLSYSFHMLRAKDKECYAINSSLLHTLSENVFALCNQLIKIEPTCLNFCEANNFSDFYKVVELCNSVLAFEGSDMQRLYTNFVTNFRQVFKDMKTFKAFKLNFPKTYRSLLEYENIQAKPLEDRFKHDLECKVLLNSGLVELGFGLFQELILRMYSKVIVEPVSVGYGKNCALYKLSDLAHSLDKSKLTNVTVSASSMPEARLKLTIMYIANQLEESFGVKLTPKDCYHTAMVKRFRSIQEGLKRARKYSHKLK